MISVGKQMEMCVKEQSMKLNMITVNYNTTDFTSQKTLMCIMNASHCLMGRW